MARYKKRDPKPDTRDPEMDDGAADRPNADKPAVLLVTPAVPEVRCKRCGGTRFDKCNAVRPNMQADKMTRRRQCVSCGQWHVMQSEPTEQERARYWR